MRLDIKELTKALKGQAKITDDVGVGNLLAAADDVMPLVVQKSLAAWFTLNTGQPTAETIKRLALVVVAWKDADTKERAIMLAMGWGWVYELTLAFEAQEGAAHV